MDKRKLTAHIDHNHGGRIEADGWGITASVDHAEDPEMIRELVKRWNMHEELVEQLKAFVRVSDWYEENSRDSPRSAMNNMFEQANVTRDILAKLDQ